ncbi:metallophosphoesterase [Paenibacillus sp. QZ-Y1]|uniref:metallophosphoesterase n=1 Tax=Paenibacillus sp. QZ-Y1 TaxID=3414511 RepID=UPI003F78E4C3
MIHNELLKQSYESINDYLIRLGDNQELYGLTWIQTADLLNKESGDEYSESRWRKKYSAYLEWKPVVLEKYANNEVVDEIRDATLESKKERVKLQTEKIEYNKMIRDQARAELLEEKIVDAVINRPTIHIPDIYIKKNNAKRDFLFPVCDLHDGVSFKLFGLEGEVLNEYSPEILEKRMWSLLEEFVSINDEQKINHVTLPNLGDSVDGILRISQLMSLKMGVTDSAIHFAEFMSQWLNELSKYCVVDYYSIFGNHDQLRLLSGKRDEFPHENAQKWITKLISANLKGNKNVSVTNCNEFMYLDILGTKILGVHGENEKNLENSIKDYSLTYNKPIHLLLSGHLHHSHEKTIGMNGVRDIEYVQSPSIIGIDDYSLKLKKTSNAGAKVMIIEENKGRTLTYNIRL